MQPGPAREAITDCVAFYPHFDSSASPWLATKLAAIHGRWHEVFSDLCKMELTPIEHCGCCSWCGSRQRFHAIDCHGHYQGVACGNCGNIAINRRIVLAWRELRSIER
jgi:hypothetical protein